MTGHRCLSFSLASIHELTNANTAKHIIIKSCVLIPVPVYAKSTPANASAPNPNIRFNPEYVLIIGNLSRTLVRGSMRLPFDKLRAHLLTMRVMGVSFVRLYTTQEPTHETP
jgi:hypothetical protein